MFEVRTEQYNGPLDKLLELIENKKLQITTLSLAEVTGDFIDYVKNLEENVAPKNLSEFVVVASRLVLIKSKVLLPNFELTNEEETEIKDLEARLKIYREFKNAALNIHGLYNKNEIAYSKPLFQNLPSIFYPPKNINIDTLQKTIARIFAGLGEFLPQEEKTVKKVLVTIEEKMNELLYRLGTSDSHSFHALRQGKTKHEIIVLFLAVLHLLKHQKIQIEQPGSFDDIIIKKDSDQKASI